MLSCDTRPTALMRKILNGRSLSSADCETANCSTSTSCSEPGSISDCSPANTNKPAADCINRSSARDIACCCCSHCACDKAASRTSCADALASIITIALAKADGKRLMRLGSCVWAKAIVQENDFIELPIQPIGLELTGQNLLINAKVIDAHFGLPPE